MFCLFFRELVLFIISAVMSMGVDVEDLFMVVIFDIISLEIVKRPIIICRIPKRLLIISIITITI